jgi:uncharacterized protein YidB (DUF937 family)
MDNPDAGFKLGRVRLITALHGAYAMSLLNDLLGGQEGAQGDGSMIAMAGQLIQRAGGVQGLLAMLQQHGLGDAAQSWVGTGANQPVSGEQLGQALQNGGLGTVVQEMAGKLGVDPSQVLGQLSSVLPHAVDHLTPNGQVPDQAQTGGFDLGALEGLAGKLFS